MNRSKSKLGSKNPLWKGNKVGYTSLHGWVKRHKPKSLFCEKCGKVTDKLDCANISGNYLRDIYDFRWLCRSCHMREDGRLNNLFAFTYSQKKKDRPCISCRVQVEKGRKRCNKCHLVYLKSRGKA